MVDDGVAKVGVMLEQLSSRFELVVEAITGIGGRIDTLRGEMVEQFAEVGKQVRFLSQQIGENRDGLAALRAELTAEIVRLGEALGATRVESRQHFSDIESALRREIADTAKRSNDQIRNEMTAAIAASRTEVRETLRADASQLRELLPAEVADKTSRQLGAEIKQIQKTLGILSKKFDRFDDKVTVEVKDHEQRLRKVERRARS